MAGEYPGHSWGKPPPQHLQLLCLLVGGPSGVNGEEQAPGRIFNVTEGLVALLNEPEPVKTIHKDGRWTVEEIINVFPATIGVELYNPAPVPVSAA